MDVLNRKLLYFMMYGENDEHCYKNICRIIGVIYKTVTNIVKNRCYERKRVTPSTKWNINGNRYGNKKE